MYYSLDLYIIICYTYGVEGNKEVGQRSKEVETATNPELRKPNKVGHLPKQVKALVR